MTIETHGDPEERSKTVPGATTVTPSEVAEEKLPPTRWSPRDLLRGDLGQFPVFIGLIVIGIIFQIASGGFFLLPQNMSSLADQVVSVTVLAVASVLVLLIGEIDLSLAAVAYFCGAIMGVLSARMHWPAAEAIGAGILAGIAIGLLNGFFVSVLRMPSFIVTLAGLIFYQGALSHILQPQTTLQIFDPTIDGIEFTTLPAVASILISAVALVVYAAFVIMARRRRQLANLPVQSTPQLALQIGLPVVLVAAVVYEFNQFQGVPLPAVITIGVVVVIWLITTKTSFGRHIYAVGGNAEAARRAGIKVVGLRVAMFTLAATLAAIGGLLIISRGNSAPALVNQYLLLNAIASAVIGGVSLFGGRGSVWGTVLGSLVVGALLNGLALLNVGPDVVEMVEGLVLLAAVLIDATARRRSVTGYR